LPVGERSKILRKRSLFLFWMILACGISFAGEVLDPFLDGGVAEGRKIQKIDNPRVRALVAAQAMAKLFAESELVMKEGFELASDFTKLYPDLTVAFETSFLVKGKTVSIKKNGRLDLWVRKVAVANSAEKSKGLQNKWTPGLDRTNDYYTGDKEYVVPRAIPGIVAGMGRALMLTKKDYPIEWESGAQSDTYFKHEFTKRGEFKEWIYGLRDAQKNVYLELVHKRALAFDVAVQVAKILSAHNDAAANKKGNWDPIETEGTGSLPDKGIMNQYQGWAALKAPGTSAHISEVLALQDGFVLLNGYGVATRFAKKEAKSEAEVKEEDPEDAEPALAALENAAKVTVPEDTGCADTGEPSTILSLQVGNAADQDCPPVTPKTKEKVPSKSKEIEVPAPVAARTNEEQALGENLYAQGLLVRELLGAIPAATEREAVKNLTPKQKKARTLAVAALVQEISQSSDPSDPVRLRNAWDESFTLGKDLAKEGLSKDDINAQRRAILLESFRVNPDGLAKQVGSMGFANLEAPGKAYDAFFTGIESREDMVRQGSAIEGALRPYRGRILGAYKMLPEADQKAMSKEFEAYEEAWFQVRMKLNALENVSDLQKNETNQKNALEAAAALKTLQEAAEAMATAAESRMKAKA
jgi:hypothetical protein